MKLHYGSPTVLGYTRRFMTQYCSPTSMAIWNMQKELNLVCKFLSQSVMYLELREPLLCQQRLKSEQQINQPNIGVKQNDSST